MDRDDETALDEHREVAGQLVVRLVGGRRGEPGRTPAEPRS
jgi:hypothetical protein